MKIPRNTKAITPVIVVPTMTDEDTFANLVEAGYLPIRSDHPEQFTILSSLGRVSGDDVMMAAMEALNARGGSISETEQAAFCRALWRRIQKCESPAQS